MQIIAIIAIMWLMQIITIFRIIIYFQGQRTGATHEHTRLSLAIRRKLHYRCPAAESWQGPCNDFRGTFSTETDCSKPAALPCTWCAPASNNCTVQISLQSGPCVWPILAAPMSQGGQLPDKICVIICIRRIIRIIVTRIKIIYRYFEIEWLLPPLDLEPGSANHISTVPTVRPRLRYKKTCYHGIYPSCYQSFSCWRYD